MIDQRQPAKKTRRPPSPELLASALLLAVFGVDLFVPPSVTVTVLYALPMLVAARWLSSRATAGVAAVAVMLFMVVVVVQRQPLGPSALRLAVLAFLAYLNYLLAVRIQAVERARQRAEQAERELQSFLGMVAHDLRGPLTAIQMNAELLQASGTSPELRRKARAIVGSEADRMRRLVDDLLDAARLGSGTFQLQPRPMELRALAREVVESHASAAPRHHIQLEAEQDLVGHWDSHRLRQLLDNLVGNAVKYSPDGGQIRVALRRQDDDAIVSIADQGVGLSPEDLPRLFQPFARGHAPAQIGGTGLGLYIAYGIVVAHGGRVSAASPGPGRGFTVNFTLPLRTPEPAAVRATTPAVIR